MDGKRNGAIDDRRAEETCEFYGAARRLEAVGTIYERARLGTVREDYSRDGEAWEFFPHDHARSRTYRWSEDGLGGFCDRYQHLCLAVALWNERDPILKERLFGLTNREGNQGEDVKEYYFYLDSTPTHSYARMLYKYPQAAYPYAGLVAQNAQRRGNASEYELIDALGEAFQENRYFDVFIAYAKADPDDILCRITAVNRGPGPAALHVLPHVWFRNTWSWGFDSTRPQLAAAAERAGTAVRVEDPHLGERWWYVEAPTDQTSPCCSRRTKRTPNGCSAARIEPRT